jgi:hypothetical protein
MTKEIELTQGQVAIVDDWRYEELNQHKWCALWDSSLQSYYATRNSATINGKRHLIRMHQVIMNTPKGFHTDHIDHNTLNNTEENLRVCTSSQNAQNRSRYSSNTSGYKGVYHYKKGWRAQIKAAGSKPQYLGTYKTPEEAALVYDKYATEYFGEFAVLNF